MVISFVILSQCDVSLQHGGFVPREWQAAKGLFKHLIIGYPCNLLAQGSH